MLRVRATSLPEQLGSCALRYRSALALRTAPPRRTWQGEPRPVERPTAPAAAPRASLVRDARLARLEAVLLLATESIAPRRLAQLASLADGTEARTLVGRLNGLYDRAGTAFRVEEIAGGYQMLSRGGYGPWLRRIHASAGETRLSTPALETLAVVAYRQPVLRADVEAIRGVQCGEILRQLMERDLVRICGRSEDLGRPFLYGTTKRFLQVFGLRHVDELPRAEQFRAWPATPNALEASTEHAVTEHQGPSEESAVTVVLETEQALEDRLQRGVNAGPSSASSRRPRTLSAAKSSDEDEEEEEELDDEEDEDDDDDGDWEDDEEDDEEEEEDDEDFEDADWEEVDDDEEEEEDDDEDDDDDDDWDDDEEEEDDEEDDE